ncbi:MAG: iron-sulfur cluster assembly scaffold protein [Actinomycetota bacterium]
MSFYPDQINELFSAPQRAGKAAKTNAIGTGASFVCGSFVRFYLEIDLQTKEIRGAKYKTNGCGFAIAAAEILTGKIKGRRLTELHGLNHAELFEELESELGKFAAERTHCAEICFDALQSALTDFRAFQLEEFAGEKALICTCFGISEETIETIIAETGAATIEEIGAVCSAGTGCGSCQFLIRELIDVYERES